MKAPRFFPVLMPLFLVLAFVAPARAKSGSVAPDLVEKARANGSVRVVVQVDVPARDEADLSREGIEVQRQAIRGAIDAVLDECGATSFAVTRRFENIRYVALEASPETLAALEASARVGTVVEEVESGAGDGIEWTAGMLAFGDRLLEAFGEKTLAADSGEEPAKAPAFGATDASATSPSFNVSFDKSTYVEGDTIRVTEFALVNPGASVKVGLKVWIKVPTYGQFTLLNFTIQLPANLNVDLGAFNLFKVSKLFPPKGTYEFNTRVTDSSGATLNEDLNSFTVQ